MDARTRTGDGYAVLVLDGSIGVQPRGGVARDLGLQAPNVADVTAIIAVGGTLLGALVGILGTLLVQRQQLRHQDRTRFHQRRLEVYATFFQACSDLAVRSLVHLDAAAKVDAMRTINITNETARLLASEPVRRVLLDARSEACEVAELPRSEARLDEFQVVIEKATMAVRKEIGTHE